MLTRTHRYALTAALATGLIVVAPLSAPFAVDAASASCAPSAADRLVPGQGLTVGRSISSPSGAFRFGLEADGSLVIRTARGGALWKQSGAGSGAHLDLKSTGNLVLTGNGGSVRWQNGVKATCASVVMLDDGRVVAVQDGVELWSIPSTRAKSVSAPVVSSTVGCAPRASDRLIPGDSLTVGRAITSRSGEYRFGLEAGGVLAIRSSRGGALWKQGPAGSGAHLDLARTGNLALTGTGGAVRWQNNVKGSCAKVVMLDDGRVVAVQDGVELWSIPSTRAKSATAPEPSATPAPTPSATATAKPTPKPTPTATATSTPKPSPTPTATATSTPKPTTAPQPTTPPEAVAPPTTGGRVAAQHPFASSAPWNTSVGSGAKFESASGTRTKAFLAGNPAVNSARWSIAVEIATTADPMATVTDLRDGKEYRVRVPSDTAPTGGTDMHVGIVQPDGYTAWEFYKMTKVGTNEWTSTRVVQTDLRTDGMRDGARASGISFFIGLIRAKEIAANRIQHSIAIGIPNSMLKDGPVWPSRTQDRDGGTEYSGPIPMGTMLAIPASVDIDSLPLSPEGKALGRALQDYGGHVLVRSNTAALFCEQSCDPADAAALHKDWGNVLFPLMRVVTNNTADNVAGGGTRRAPNLPGIS